MNRKFSSIDAFSELLDAKSEQILGVLNEMAQVGGELIFEHAFEMYGENPPLADLAPATQADRVKRGYTPNDPLLRNGALLRAQVTKQVKRVVRRGAIDESSAGAGSPEKINLYHELGYMNARTGRPVPPRPVFMLTAKQVGPQLAEVYSAEVKRVFGS